MASYEDYLRGHIEEVLREEGVAPTVDIFLQAVENRIDILGEELRGRAECRGAGHRGQPAHAEVELKEEIGNLEKIKTMLDEYTKSDQKGGG